MHELSCTLLNEVELISFDDGSQTYIFYNFSQLPVMVLRLGCKSLFFRSRRWWDDRSMMIFYENAHGNRDFFLFSHLIFFIWIYLRLAKYYNSFYANHWLSTLWSCNQYYANQERSSKSQAKAEKSIIEQFVLYPLPSLPSIGSRSIS